MNAKGLAVRWELRGLRYCGCLAGGFLTGKPLAVVAIGERAQPVLDLVRPEVGDAAELQEREQTNAEPQTEEKKLEAALQTEREMDKELRAQQEQLSLALEAAQQANKSKTVFLNNMSHDIRTLMNAIIGFTSLAESHVDQQEKVKEYLRKIVVSSEHLLSLINDVLDMSRIESGKVKVDEKPLHLPALIDDLRAIIQPSADGKRVDFRIEMDGAANADPSEHPQQRREIQQRRRRACAARHARGAGPSGVRNVSFRGQGYRHRYERGVPEARFRNVLARRNGRGQRNPGHGTGLDMAITKKNSELLGGTISKSSPG